MSLLLSFYDAYWNDNFIQDRYEWQKGTYDSENDELTKTFAPLTEADDWDDYVRNNVPSGEETYPYYNYYAFDNSHVFLEPYLISIGRELGYHRDFDETLGLNNNETLHVLWYYLFVDRGFSDSEVSLCYLEGDDDEIAEKALEVLDKGYPLIYIGKRQTASGTLAGHELIAYGVDSSGDILLHTGWSNDEYQKMSTTTYPLYKALIWIEITPENLPHTHSYMYEEAITHQELCACQIYKYHPVHNQNHTYFVKNDTAKQYEECACGDSHILHYHSDREYTYINGSIHNVQCGVCEYSYRTTHEYYLESISSVQHRQICKCGKIGATNDHIASRYVNKTKFMHNITCECGYIMGTAHHSVVTDNNRYSHCVDCGAIFDNFSDVIIKKYDDDTIPLID